MAEQTGTLNRAGLALAARDIRVHARLLPAVLAFRPVPVRGAISGEYADPPEGPVCMTVLAAAEEYELDAAGQPQWWKPARAGNVGTYKATLEIAWGTVLEETFNEKAAVRTVTDMIGHNVSGSVLDAVETLTVRCELSLLTRDRLPKCSDTFIRDRREWTIFEVTKHNVYDDSAELTVAAVRWEGLNRAFTPRVFAPPANWS